MINKRAPPPSTDLLVCFPSRAHLALMPKPINSPIRSSDHSNKKTNFPRRRHHHHRRGSPILWARTKPTADISEPTSPKVTCAGQIKVRHKSKSNWQSVIEEIERLHGSDRKQGRKNSSVFKKEAINFLACLRGIRLNFRCLGSFSTSDITSEDDDDGDGEDEEDDDYVKENRQHYENSRIGPPPNALLLMRSRSAPAKSWPEEENVLKVEEEEDNSKKSNSLEAIMRHDIDFYLNTGDIVKETWLIGNPNPNPRCQPVLQRSRSSKR